MKRILSISLAMVAAIALCSCTERPIPSSYVAMTQLNLQSAFHWDVLANDVADQIKVNLASRRLADRPVFVQPATETPFGEGFRTMLVTRLVNKNVRTLVDKRDGALVVNYEIQVVHHKKGITPEYLPLTVAYLSGAVAVVRDVFIHRDTGRGILAIGGAIFGLGALNEAMGGSFLAGGPPNTEIIFTTSVAAGGEFVMRKTDCYYVNTQDYWLYTSAKTKNIKVTD